jgi:hypothetical protein
MIDKLRAEADGRDIAPSPVERAVTDAIAA